MTAEKDKAFELDTITCVRNHAPRVRSLRHNGYEKISSAFNSTSFPSSFVRRTRRKRHKRVRLVVTVSTSFLNTTDKNNYILKTKLLSECYNCCVLNQTGQGRKLVNRKVPRSWSIQILLVTNTHMTTTQRTYYLLLLYGSFCSIIFLFFLYRFINALS